MFSIISSAVNPQKLGDFIKMLTILILSYINLFYFNGTIVAYNIIFN
jgi:hypothetical protein